MRCLHNKQQGGMLVPTSTGLHEAVVVAWKKEIEELFESGADIAEQDEDGRTILHLAVLKGDFAIVEMILEQWPGIIDIRSLHKSTPLHFAASRGLPEITQLLIERGADINAKDVYERTPLHRAVEYNKTEIVRILIERGAKVDDENIHKRTCLHSAAETGNMEILEILVDYGADLDAQDECGETPLHFACNAAVKQFLISKGAALLENGDQEKPIIPS